MSLISGSYSLGSEDMAGAPLCLAAAVEKLCAEEGEVEEEVRADAVEALRWVEARPARRGAARRTVCDGKRSDLVAVLMLRLTADMIRLGRGGEVEGAQRRSIGGLSTASCSLDVTSAAQWV